MWETLVTGVAIFFTFQGPKLIYRFNLYKLQALQVIANFSEILLC